MIEILQYHTESGENLFAAWFKSLDKQTSLRIMAAVYRLEQGNFSNAKSVGEGVQEYRLDFGPGYRIYFGKDGEQIVILLAGGTKKRQQQDIDAARVRWANYKQRKKAREE